MVFKTFNDLVGINELVPTLLVFGVYPQMTEWHTSSPSITQLAMAMRKTMDKLRRCITS